MPHRQGDYKLCLVCNQVVEYVALTEHWVHTIPAADLHSPVVDDSPMVITELCGLDACDLAGFCQARSDCPYGVSP